MLKSKATILKVILFLSLFLGCRSFALASSCTQNSSTLTGIPQNISSFSGGSDYTYTTTYSGNTYVCDFASDNTFTTGEAGGLGGDFYRAINGTSGGSGSSLCLNFGCTAGHYYLSFRGTYPNISWLTYYSPTGTTAVPYSLSFASCTDGIQNQDETSIDNGGVCTTRIVDFTPVSTSTPISSPVTFTLEAFINQLDLNGILGITITLHNIDQNVLLFSDFSPSDIVLLDNYEITTAGTFNYTSDPQTLGDGNYRIEASIQRSYLGGWIVNPWSSINQSLSHSFVVGAPTFIGNISNNMFNEVNTLTGGYSGTSTASELAGTCIPSIDFNVIKCMQFLFIPDSQQLNSTVVAMKDGIFTRAPWGYFTRFYTIISNPATVALPTISIDVKASDSDYFTVGFDPTEMFAGASSLVDSIHAPLDNTVTFKGTFETMIKLLISLGVVLTIIADLTGSHKHSESSDKKKLS